MIFEVAVIFLGLLWALSLWYFLNYSKRQRELVLVLPEPDPR